MRGAICSLAMEEIFFITCVTLVLGNPSWKGGAAIFRVSSATRMTNVLAFSNKDLQQIYRNHRAGSRELHIPVSFHSGGAHHRCQHCRKTTFGVLGTALCSQNPSYSQGLITRSGSLTISTSPGFGQKDTLCIHMW